MVTAYDYPSAMHVDRAGIDVVLVGDSCAMVELGFETTLVSAVVVGGFGGGAVRCGVLRRLSSSSAVALRAFVALVGFGRLVASVFFRFSHQGSSPFSASRSRSTR